MSDIDRFGPFVIQDFLRTVPCADRPDPSGSPYNLHVCTR